MNKIFKSVWNKSTRTWVAVSEKADGYQKSGSKSVSVLSDSEKHASFFQKSFISSVIASSIFLFAPVSQAAVLNWNTSATGNWFDAINWNLGTIPTGADLAIINNGGTAIINAAENASPSDVKIGNVTAGTVRVDTGGNLTANSLTVGDNAQGHLHINGGQVRSTGYSDMAVGLGSGEGLITIDQGGSLTTAQYLNIGYTGKGTLILNNGTVTPGNNYSVHIGAQAGSEGLIIVNGGLLKGTLGGGDNFVIGREGKGTLEINNSGKATANWIFVGGEYRGGATATSQGGTGKIIINDDGLLESTAGIVTGGFNSSAEIEINDNGKMYTTNGAAIYLGYEGPSNVVVNGGTINSAGGLNIGALANSDSYLTVNNGLVQAAATMFIGNQGAANVTLNNGEINSQSTTHIGREASGTGTLTINAGKFNALGAVVVGTTGTGTVTLNNGVIYNPNVIWVGYDATAVGTLNLNGGLLQTNTISGNNGTSTVNLNGTKIQALSNNTNFIKQLTTLTVGSNGAVIDSNGFNIGINSALSGANNTTFTKIGNGTLTMSVANSAYQGQVVVEQGTLALGVNGVFDNAASITLNNNAILDTQGTMQTLNALSGDSASSIQMGSAQLTLHNDATQNTVFAGSIYAGAVTKTGAGALTLTNNSTIGSLSHTQGALNISGGHTVTANGNVTISGSNTVLGVELSAAPAIITTGTANLVGTPTVDLTGYSPSAASDEGIGIYTLIQTTGGVSGSINATVGGQPLNSFVDISKYLVGSVYVDGLDLIADVTLVWNHTGTTSAHGTFNITGNNTFTVGSSLSDRSGGVLGFGWDGQTLTKKGTGTLNLDGINTYSGLTRVEAGTLIVGSQASLSSAQIAGDVDVLSGARLGGHGKILGDVHLNSGATIAPGNSIGTLTVGTITFEPGSHYEFEAYENGQADQIIATDRATINGGTVNILANGNIWKTTDTYTILSTSNGVTGIFEGLTTNLAFLQPELTYDANNAYLTFSRNSTGLGDVGMTFNQRQTGYGIASLGSGNAIYDRILSMDAQSARNAYDNLSGEIHASLKGAVLTNSRYTRDAVNGRLMARSNGAHESQADTARGLWGSTWAHDGHLKDDGNAARTNQNGGGLLIGADYAFSENTVAGIAIGYEHTSVDVGGLRRSDADINAYHLMAYGSTKAGEIDLRGAIGYARLDIDTKRHITVNGLQSLNEASYNGALMQAFIEGSHTFALTPQVSIAPYVNMAYTQIQTDDFNEKGNSTALQNHTHTDHVVTTTLGGRGEWKFGTQEQHTIFADLGWQHRFGDKAPEVRVNFAQGNDFTIRGNELGRNSAVIGLGANFELQHNLDLRVGYQGEFGSQVKDNAVQVQLQWRF